MALHENAKYNVQVPNGESFTARYVSYDSTTSSVGGRDEVVVINRNGQEKHCTRHPDGTIHDPWGNVVTDYSIVRDSPYNY